MELKVRSLTPARWPDLEAIFGARGCSQARACWCMYYRRSGDRNLLRDSGRRSRAYRAGLKALVDAGRPPGLIAYSGKTPVGWISFGPREEFARLKRSPVMKPVDDKPVWSIICFVVPPEYRGRGIARMLLREAIAYARKHGATIVEAYPMDKRGRSDDNNMWFGPKSMFDSEGFREIARRKPERPIVRLEL